MREALLKRQAEKAKSDTEAKVAASDDEDESAKEDQGNNMPASGTRVNDGRSGTSRYAHACCFPMYPRLLLMYYKCKHALSWKYSHSNDSKGRESPLVSNVTACRVFSAASAMQ